MTDALKWTDADEIGYQLSERFPSESPLAVRFTDLHGRVIALDGFDDDPAASSEGLLEAIQMAWLQYAQDH